VPTAELTDDGKISIWSEWSDKDLIKSLPGAKWNAEAGVWQVPRSWASCKALRGTFSSRLQIGTALAAWATQERQTRIDPAIEQRLLTEGDGDEDLRPFQRAGVQFLLTAQSALLGDEMGTGKTVQLIRTLQHRGDDAYPVCVICPNTVKSLWRKEWARWNPMVNVIVIDGGLVQKRKQFVEAEKAIARGEHVAVVINIEAVMRHSRIAPYGSYALEPKEKEPKELNMIPFRTVIVDEAHRMKEAKGKQTRSIWAVQHGPTVKYCYALTGTPIANHMGELWSIMHGISPDEYPSKTKYVDRYCIQGWNGFGGLDIIGVRPDTKDEFFSVFDPRFRRMAKNMVLPQLPPKQRLIYEVEMGAKQAKAYKDMAASMFTKLDDGTLIMATNNLTRNTRLLQFASSYATVDEVGNVRLEEPSAKLDVMCDLLTGELENDTVAISAESRQLIMLAAARLDKLRIPYRMIVGGMSQESREQAIADFQNGIARVMFYTLKAGGVGITLTRANVGLCLQRSWSMIDNKQGEDRYHRIGSEIHDKIMVIDFVTRGTIEEVQIPRLHEKFTKLQEITRDRDVAIAAGDTAAVARYDAELAQVMNTPLWPTSPGAQIEGETTDD